ncbi:hypothetical protein C7M84_008622 [Penaeus vannamei]|uniref:Uncharacterized protein n=1 Tax=Penaeus vannamei TaxID=6689 RepID=A0A3R7PIF2_PENVA|nr:hypothetical protein C7M84_008622 [Penaeus vannamei]
MEGKCRASSGGREPAEKGRASRKGCAGQEEGRGGIGVQRGRPDEEGGGLGPRRNVQAVEEGRHFLLLLRMSKNEEGCNRVPALHVRALVATRSPLSTVAFPPLVRPSPVRGPFHSYGRGSQAGRRPLSHSVGRSHAVRVRVRSSWPFPLGRAGFSPSAFPLGGRLHCRPFPLVAATRRRLFPTLGLSHSSPLSDVGLPNSWTALQVGLFPNSCRSPPVGLSQLVAALPVGLSHSSPLSTSVLSNSSAFPRRRSRRRAFPLAPALDVGLSTRGQLDVGLIPRAALWTSGLFPTRAPLSARQPFPTRSPASRSAFPLVGRLDVGLCPLVTGSPRRPSHSSAALGRTQTCSHSVALLNVGLSHSSRASRRRPFPTPCRSPRPRAFPTRGRSQRRAPFHWSPGSSDVAFSHLSGPLRRRPFPLVAALRTSAFLTRRRLSTVGISSRRRPFPLVAAPDVSLSHSSPLSNRLFSPLVAALNVGLSHSSPLSTSAFPTLSPLSTSAFPTRRRSQRRPLAHSSPF